MILYLKTSQNIEVIKLTDTKLSKENVISQLIPAHFKNNEGYVLRETEKDYDPATELLDIVDGKLKVLELPKDESLKNVLLEVTRQIREYDLSDAVNEFFIDGQSFWLSFEERSKIRVRIDNTLKKEKDTLNLFLNGKPFNMSVERAQQIIVDIEDYAIQCYDVTQSHIAAIGGLTHHEKVRDYNYKKGYPDKLNFEI